MATCQPIKREVLKALTDEAWEQRLMELADRSLKSLISPLFSALCQVDPILRWRGIHGLGIVVSRLAEGHMEDARVVLRRLMWNLNEESGGIGWGSAEAMGEILALSEPLAKEYHSILLSYIHQRDEGDDNYLELPALRQGALWGIARLAEVRPQLAAKAIEDLRLCLNDSDPTIRGLACKVFAVIGSGTARTELERLTRDNTAVDLYWDQAMQPSTVGTLAIEALRSLYH